MKTLIFGQTPEMAKEFKESNEFLFPLDGAKVITTHWDIPAEDHLTVYLVGDWEIGEHWPSVFSKLRQQASVYVVKMFIASEVV